MSIRALHIPHDIILPVQLVEISAETEPSVDQLQTLVEGHFEPVTVLQGIDCWVNEEGKIIGLPANSRAQVLFDETFGPSLDFLVGSAVLTGGTDEEGRSLSLSDEQFAMVRALLGNLIAVEISNSYSDGHESTSTVLLEGPEALTEAALEDWWAYVVFPHTGDGHGADSGLSAVHTATVIAGPADLLNKNTEWGN